MKVSFVREVALDDLLDADHASWGRGTELEIPLIGTPVGMQPTAAIRVAWMNKKIGTVDRVVASALHNGSEIAFRLEWASPTESAEVHENDSFPDAAAIALPVASDAPVVTMGAPGLPVNAWYWRADEPRGARQLSAEGLGTSQTFDSRVIQGRGAWKHGRWRVVLARALRVESEGPVASLEPGATTGFGVAIWDGANAERAGVKSFSGDWLPLEIEAGSREGNAS